MSVTHLSRRTPVLVAVLGVLAFVLLAGRFSPNWLAFLQTVREASTDAVTPEQHAALDRAVFSGHSERGLYVIRQARDLNAEIDNSVHKIVRWRLLVPVLGHYLRLPDWVTLGLAHLGCLALVVALIGIGLGRAAAPGRPRLEAFCLAVIAGATAPFFTSMGWVGYYDSLLALALLGVAFARPRWVVMLACLAAPWIDERFVIGLPLALGIRWILSDRTTQRVSVWFQQQALIPLAVVSGYAVIRLNLGGSGGSQTVADYLQEFVFAEKFPAGQRLFGAWAGLRVAWALVIAAVIGVWLAGGASRRLAAWLLAAGVAGTGVVGLVTALDMSRSMVLLLPAVPLGWMFAARTAWWRTYQAGPVLAVLALALPASQVVAKSVLPVDAIWSYSVPLMTAQNNLGLMYATGDGVPQDGARAARWLRRPAEEGVGISQENLGVLYANGDGVPKDMIQAYRWLSLSRANGQASAADKLAIIERNMSAQDIARAKELAQQWIDAQPGRPAPKQP